MVEYHRAGGGLDGAQDAAARRGLAAARFAHQAERLALGNAKGYPVNRLDAADLTLQEAALDGKMLDQVDYFEDLAIAAR